jgi:outer membrane protein TolC
MKFSAGAPVPFVVLFILMLSPFARARQTSETGDTGVTPMPPNLFGSVTQGSPTAGTIPLSIADAIDRALKYNIGPVISQLESRISAAKRLRSLSELLPRINVTVGETVEQIDLAAYGFTSFPGVSSVVGPFNVVDARAHYSQTAVDFKLLHELRSDSAKVTAASLAQQDVRELVVLITTNLYLQAVGGSSRLDAARAQLRTSQAVYDRAVDLKDSGVIPGIDLLRAQVLLREQQQRVLATENDLAKQKLNLARAIGLPQGQEFSQTNTFVTETATIPPFEAALSTALESRPDYRRALTLVRAAEEARKAAEARKLPSVAFSADYGTIGEWPTTSHGTMTVQGAVLVPIYTGGRTRSEILESDSKLEERKAEESNLRGRIEYEIRTANLDIRSAAEQVRVAQQAHDLAQQQLTQAQDRFAAGVTNGLEVTQAQEAVVTADENYISSLYTLNVAEAALARAMGTAEKTIKSFFGGK